MSDEEEPRELTDPAALKALGHPLRQRILRQLNREGPATSTSIAQALGQNTGTTSYHLRLLAEHGFVDEVPDRGRGRERWWQARPQDVRFTRRSELGTEARAAFDEFSRLGVADDLESFRRFEQQREALGEWGDALLFARGALDLTPEQLVQFWQDYMELYNRYSGRAAPSDDTHRVLLRFVAFPDVGEPSE